MIAVTNSPELVDGLQIIAENHDLKQRLRHMEMLEEARINTKEREYEYRRRQMERTLEIFKENRERELNEAIAEGERLLARDRNADPYLRRIDERAAGIPLRHVRRKRHLFWRRRGLTGR